MTELLLGQSASLACTCPQVGQAAPVCVAMIAEGGRDRENTLSEMYGGKGNSNSGANPLYEAIGDVSLFAVPGLVYQITAACCAPQQI